MQDFIGLKSHRFHRSMNSGGPGFWQVLGSPGSGWRGGSGVFGRLGLVGLVYLTFEIYVWLSKEVR